ncbi:Metal transporter cnnm2 [Cichlidogyrus casuarinus]|uniref:Metal transporter cnnm2 n=1 Tax=Cichlidogyrus casuarinus TaxID=1844966 RepID=A0ABD2QCH9_9PLAT
MLLITCLVLFVTFVHTVKCVKTHENVAIHSVAPRQFSQTNNGSYSLALKTEVYIEIYGDHLDLVKDVAFSNEPSEFPARCKPTMASIGEVEHLSNNVIAVSATFPITGTYYLCIKLDDNFIYPNTVPSRSFKFDVEGPLLPLWLHIILLIILFILSGIFSGLNLGLMALGKTELKLIEAAGSETEKRYAKTIRPVRERGNFLLCTLLVGNVLVNNSLAILMDDLTGNGIYAIIVSTLGITIFGEIVPQAVCSRHGLCVGAKTIWLTKLFMVVTFPIAFPVSIVLDYMLGEEIGAVYNRKKLAVLVKEQEVAGTVARDEMNIITGALAMTTKTVEDVMTPLSDTFMLSYYDVLDFNALNEIFSNGFTRIPVYGESRSDIRAILNVKDLAFVNPDHNVPVSTICEFYNRSVIIVPNHTTLECMLKEFRQGKAHMAFVERLVKAENTDPQLQTIGLVTLEDVIEEIIQAEIVDETDIVTDNVNRSVRNLRKRDFRIFNSQQTSIAGTQVGSAVPISPQLKITALRHLASDVAPFKENHLSLSILQSMLNCSDLVFRVHTENSRDGQVVLLEKGVKSNAFFLIVQGSAEVQFGSDELTFPAGPFYSFGEPALAKVNELFDELMSLEKIKERIDLLKEKAYFVPQYTVIARTKMECIRITTEHYFLAKYLSHYRAVAQKTLTRTSIDAGVISDIFESAWDKYLEECRASGDGQTQGPEQFTSFHYHQNGLTDNFLADDVHHDETDSLLQKDNNPILLARSCLNNSNNSTV